MWCRRMALRRACALSSGGERQARRRGQLHNKKRQGRAPSGPAAATYAPSAKRRHGDNCVNLHFRVFIPYSHRHTLVQQDHNGDMRRQSESRHAPRPTGPDSRALTHTTASGAAPRALTVLNCACSNEISKICILTPGRHIEKHRAHSLSAFDTHTLFQNLHAHTRTTLSRQHSQLRSRQSWTVPSPTSLYRLARARRVAPATTNTDIYICAGST